MRMTLAGVDELQKMLKASMPVRLDYVDPFTQQQVVLLKEDVIRLLLVNVHDLVTDAAILPGLLVEFSRAQRACEYSETYSEGVYRQWKAQLVEKARAAAKGKDEKFTEAMGENAYRTHPDYAKVSSEPARWKLYGNLFSDLKEAVQLKGQILNGQLRNLGNHDRLMATADAQQQQYPQGGRRG